MIIKTYVEIQVPKPFLVLSTLGLSAPAKHSEPVAQQSSHVIFSRFGVAPNSFPVGIGVWGAGVRISSGAPLYARVRCGDARVCDLALWCERRQALERCA